MDEFSGADFLARLPGPISAASRQLFAIWQGWRRGRPLPERRDLDVKQFGDFHIVMELRHRDDIRITSIGAGVTRYLGFNLTGLNYLDITNPENRALRARLFIEQVLQPCGSVLYYPLRYADGGVLPVECAGAPFSDDDGSGMVSLMAGCCTPLIPPRPDDVIDPDSWLVGEGMRFIDLGFGIPPADPSTPRHMLPAF
jgi:hypothetical protein